MTREAYNVGRPGGSAMANPFPGMDPYLEGDFWESVHANLATEITMALSPVVRPKYAVVTTRRVILTGSDADEAESRSRWPDVGVATHHPSAAGAGTAVAVVPFEAS